MRPVDARRALVCPLVRRADFLHFFKLSEASVAPPSPIPLNRSSRLLS